MQCNAPLIKAELNEVYQTKTGKLSPKYLFVDRDKWDKGEYNDKIGIGNLYRKIYPVGCGQCIPCRLDYARDRATQMMLETKIHPEEECWFGTVTYNDEHVPHHTVKYLLPEQGEWETVTGLSLDKRNAQLFWKRVDKRYGHVKKVYCGEYGSETNRPHGHFIAWGLPLDLSRLKKWKNNEWGQPMWRCEELEELWSEGDRKEDIRGNIIVARVSWEDCCYVARYTLKKALGKTKEDYNKWYQMNGKRPEYIIWSNGVGKDYLLDNLENIYKYDQVPVLNKKTGDLTKPPTSYDRILEKIDPELHKSIKEKRQKQAQTYNYMANLNNPFSPEERRAISEARMKAIMQDFRTKEI